MVGIFKNIIFIHDNLFAMLLRCLVLVLVIFKWRSKILIFLLDRGVKFNARVHLIFRALAIFLVYCDFGSYLFKVIFVLIYIFSFNLNFIFYLIIFFLFLILILIFIFFFDELKCIFRRFFLFVKIGIFVYILLRFFLFFIFSHKPIFQAWPLFDGWLIWILRFNALVTFFLLLVI